jgi:hypothetical protein
MRVWESELATKVMSETALYIVFQEAKSTMTAANPRSSIVAFLACALAASTASSSSAMASCPSV